MADGAEGTAIRWALFPDATRAELRTLLGPIVTVANPLDYHTFIWGDTERMTDTFAAVLGEGFDLSVFVLDLPRPDRCSQAGYRCAVDAILAARAATGARTAVLASLPEALDETLTAEFEAGGVTVLHGMADGLSAIDAAILAGRLAPDPAPALLARSGPARTAVTLSEAEGKAALAAHRLRVPPRSRRRTRTDRGGCRGACAIPWPSRRWASRTKTEAGAVILASPTRPRCARPPSALPPWGSSPRRWPGLGPSSSSA
jgi:acyl-CoA synthetase (NDP forming)